MNVRNQSTSAIRIPAEWEPHACCWMAWAVDPTEWRAWTEAAETELATVVRAIAKHEPVRLLTPTHKCQEAGQLFSRDNVEIVDAPVGDIWMRDIAPIFALEGNKVVAIDLNFNAWGNTRDR